MLKFTIKIVLFGLLTLISFQLVEKYFIKENRYNYTYHRFNRLSNDLEFDLLFFGSSKSYCGYNPTIFKHNLNLNSYNLAGQGQVLEVTRLVIEEALKKTKPKLIVVDVAYSMVAFNEKDSLSDKRKSYQLSVLDNYILSINKSKYIFDIYDEDKSFYALSPLIRNHDKWLDTYEKNFKKPYLLGKNNLFLSNNGYIGTLQYLGPEGKEVSKKMNLGYEALSNQNNIQVSKKEIDIIKDIKKIGDKFNVDILFVSTPSIKDYVNKLSYYQNLEKVFKDFDLKYLNLYKYFDEIGIKAEFDFKEIQHLNYNGGFKTSQFLSKYISENYDFIKNTSIRNDLDKNITYHLLTNLAYTNKLIDEPFEFDSLISADDIGYFYEDNGSCVFILKLKKNINLKLIENKYNFYVRYFNGEVKESNKKVKAYPFETIKVNGDKFIFARLQINNKKMSKMDMFFLKKEKPSKTRNVLSLKNITLND